MACFGKREQTVQVDKLFFTRNEWTMDLINKIADKRKELLLQLLTVNISKRSFIQNHIQHKSAFHPSISLHNNSSKVFCEKIHTTQSMTTLLLSLPLGTETWMRCIVLSLYFTRKGILGLLWLVHSKHHLIEGSFLITRSRHNVFVICRNIAAQYRGRLFGLEEKRKHELINTEITGSTLCKVIQGVSTLIQHCFTKIKTKHYIDLFSLYITPRTFTF